MTGHSGEEATQSWVVQHKQGRQWQVNAVCSELPDLQGGVEEEELPTVPHPRHSPEAVVAAQLQALARSDLYSAAQFCCFPPKADASHAHAGT